jgi:hypothetical protein
VVTNFITDAGLRGNSGATANNCGPPTSCTSTDSEDSGNFVCAQARASSGGNAACAQALPEPNNTLNPSATPKTLCLKQGSVVRAQTRFKSVARTQLCVKSVARARICIKSFARAQIGANKEPVFACKPVITAACFFISTHSIQKKSFDRLKMRGLS